MTFDIKSRPGIARVRLGPYTEEQKEAIATLALAEIRNYGRVSVGWLAVHSGGSHYVVKKIVKDLIASGLLEYAPGRGSFGARLLRRAGIRPVVT